MTLPSNTSSAARIAGMLPDAHRPCKSSASQKSAPLPRVILLDTPSLSFTMSPAPLPSVILSPRIKSDAHRATGGWPLPREIVLLLPLMCINARGWRIGRLVCADDSETTLDRREAAEPYSQQPSARRARRRRPPCLISLQRLLRRILTLGVHPRAILFRRVP